MNTDTAAIVAGDPMQVAQAVSHLLDNAIEATGKTGTIRLRTDIVVLGSARAAALADLAAGRYLRVQVEDSGTGMDEATLARAAEPFFTTREFGRGLGLSAAHGIAVSHAGALSIWSRPGEGTRVDLYLPAR